MATAYENYPPIDSEGREGLSGAWRVLDNYIKTAGGLERPDLREHTERVCEKVHQFAGDIMPPAVQSAIVLSHAAARLTDGKYDTTLRKAAAEAILEYATDEAIRKEEAGYVLALLSSMAEIELAAGKNRRDLAEQAQSDDSPVTEHMVEVIADSYQGEIPPDYWRLIEPILDCNDMRRLLNRVNIESVIIQSCELLDNLEHPSSKRPSAWLQDVLESESFYAPLCEVLGLEGLASTLRSKAENIRLTHQGRPDLIEKAESRLESIAKVGVERIMADAFGLPDDKFDTSRVVYPDEKTGRAPVDVGEFAAEKDDGSLVAGNWRLKAVGSLADKYERYDGEDPKDMVGLMVISVDVQQSAIDFADYIEHKLLPRHNDMLSHIAMCAAQSKQSAIYIQGTADYVAAIERELESRGIDRSLWEAKVQSADNVERAGYEKLKVAKVTFEMAYELKGVDELVVVPVEMQFLTKEERHRSRLREIAHIIYKYIDSHRKRKESEWKEQRFSKEEREYLLRQFDEWSRDTRKNMVEVLGDIYDRMSRLNPNTLEVNGQSRKTVDALLTEAEAVFMA